MSLGRYLDDQTDDEIIAAVVGGNQQAFRALVVRYQNVVARTVIGMLGPGDDADEAGQLTFLKLYQGLSSFRGEAALSTFITKIAMNTSLDLIRKRERDRARFGASIRDIDDQEMVDGPGMSAAMEGIELNDLVTRALSQLSPPYRAVTMLRLVQGLSTKEVSELLGVSEGTVHSRLSRARDQLRKILAPEVGEHYG
ncbi:MAG: RNA polymerase sigma factor [Pseudomonadota bacterium]